MKFTSEDNQRLRKIVKAFNARQDRMALKGYRVFRDNLKVYDIKQRYKNQPRSSYNKELKMLEQYRFSNVKKIGKKETKAGGTMLNWKINYFNLNQPQAVEYFSEQYKRISKKIGRFPGERLQLNATKSKLNLLSKPVEQMSQSELNSYQATIREYLAYPGRRKGGYRGFLSEVSFVMHNLGYNDEQINKVLKKFDKLTPDEFFKLYDENDLIQRVYDMADSPTVGGIELNLGKDDAEELINDLIESADFLVKKYKET